MQKIEQSTAIAKYLVNLSTSGSVRHSTTVND